MRRREEQHDRACPCGGHRDGSLLVATGRTANLTHMGVESVGIDRTKWLPVDVQHKPDLQS